MCNATLRGLLHIENVSYGIEPLQNSSNFEHIFYRMDDVYKEPLKCGISNKDIEKEIIKDDEEEPHQLFRRRRAVLPQTRYVELFIVVDKERVGLVTVFLLFQEKQMRSEHPMKET